MTDFERWRDFDYAQANINLWVFKKSSTPQKFRAWHVRTDQLIEDLFRSAVATEVRRITEFADYTPIAQTNESSCLIQRLEDSVGTLALLDQVDAPEVENVDAQLKHLKGAAGYLVKFEIEEDIVYAIRKTAPTWKPTVRKSLINAVFKNGELSVVGDDSFSFDSYFDFYSFNESIFVSHKRSYEAVVSEKGVYERSFRDLTIDPSFCAIFSDMAPLVAYVGNNAMQLRRITVIQQKGLYRMPDFCQKLKIVNARRNWGLNFDGNEKLMVCAATAKTIMQALLDHRLFSELTEITYDVPDAEVV